MSSASSRAASVPRPAARVRKSRCGVMSSGSVRVYCHGWFGAEPSCGLGRARAMRCWPWAESGPRPAVIGEGRLRAIKRFKDALSILQVDAGSAIAHGEDQLCADALDAEVYRGIGRRVPQRVFEEIAENAQRLHEIEPACERGAI